MIIRCGICYGFHRSDVACHYCGAYRVMVNGNARYFDRRTLIEMVRGIPTPLHQTIERASKILGN